MTTQLTDKITITQHTTRSGATRSQYRHADLPSNISVEVYDGHGELTISPMTTGMAPTEFSAYMELLQLVAEHHAA